jgi:hypothetical protein
VCDRRVLCVEKEGLGLRTRKRVGARPDNAVEAGVLRSYRASIGQTFHSSEHRFRKRRAVIGIQFVKIKPRALPVLMKTEAQVKLRLPVKPINELRSPVPWAPVPVRVHTLRIRAAVQHKPNRVQARAQPNVAVRPGVFAQQFPRCQRSAGSSPNSAEI